MDIARLGVVIDPAKAVDGGKKTEDTLRKVGETAKTELKKVDDAANKAGESTQKMAATGRRSFSDFTSGMVNLMDGLGMMDGGFGSVIRRVMSMQQAIQQARQMMGGIAGASSAAAGGMAAISGGAAAAATAMTASTAATTANAAASTAATMAAGFLATAESTKAAAAAQAASATASNTAATVAATTASAAHAASTAATAASTTGLVAVMGTATTAMTAYTTAVGRATVANTGLVASNSALGRVSAARAMAIGDNGMRQARGRVIDPQQIGQVDGMSNSLLRLTNQAGAVPPALRAIAPAASSAGSASAAAGISFGSLAAAATALIIVLGSLAVALGVVKVAYAAWSAGSPLAANMESDTVAMETMIGSATKAKQVMDDLNTLAAKTPLGSEELISSGRSLLAFGESADTVVESLRRIGDVSSGVRQPIGQIAELYGKARVQGTLYAEDINQLIGRGIPVIQLFAEQLGVSTGEVKKMGSEGKISFSNLEKAFVTMTSEGGQFFNMMAKQADTFNGKVSTIEDNWKAVLRGFAAPINDSLKPLLDMAIQLLEDMEPHARAVGDALAQGIDIAVGVIKSGQIGEFLRLSMMAALEFVAAAWLTGFQFVIGNVVGFLISSVIGAIQSVITIILSLFTATVNFIAKLVQGDFAGAFGAVGDFFLNLFTGGGGIISNIGKTIYNSVGGALTDAVNSFIQAFYKAWQAVDRTIQAGKASFGVDVGGGKEALGPIAPKPMTFKPLEIKFGDLTAASDKLVGTGNRDALAKFTEQFIKGRGPLGDGAVRPGLISDPTGNGKNGKGGDIPKAKEVELLDTQVQKLIKDWQDLGKQMDQTIADIGQSMNQNLTGGIMDVITGTKDLKSAFGDMAMSIINDIVRMVIQMYVQLAVANMLAALGYGGSGGAGYSVGGRSYGGAYHTGGVTNSRTAVHSGGYGSFHTGGITTAEAMVKTERGESILTQRRGAELERALESRQNEGKSKKGEQGLTIINNMDQNQILDVIAANPGALINTLSRKQPELRRMAMSKDRP